MKTALILAVFLAGPVLAGEVKVTAYRKVIDFSNPENRSPVGAAIKQLEITRETKDAPVTRLVEPHFTSIELAGRTVHVVFGKVGQGSELPDRAAVDRNVDGKFSEDEIFKAEAKARPHRDGTVAAYSMLLRAQEIVIDDVTYRCNMYFSRAPGQEWGGRFIGLWYLDGRFKVGEKEFRVVVVDTDLDGTFSGPEDLWLLRDTKKVGLPASAFTMVGRDEGRFFDGHRFELKGMKGTELTIAYEAAEGPRPADEAKARARMARTWAKKLDGERENFIKERGLDTTRARTKATIPWRYIGMAEAKAAAKAEGKHLFVDVMAFGSVWCSRMDYYTYVDAEVAELLSGRFVCVKLIQEQDMGGEHAAVRKELRARRVPVMGIWSPDGKLVHKISSWKRPEDLLAELHAALDTKKGGD